MSSKVSRMGGWLVCSKSNKGGQCGHRQVSKGNSTVNQIGQARWMGEPSRYCKDWFFLCMRWKPVEVSENKSGMTYIVREPLWLPVSS